MCVCVRVCVCACVRARVCVCVCVCARARAHERGYLRPCLVSLQSQLYIGIVFLKFAFGFYITVKL